jgi:hypothetical protein
MKGKLIVPRKNKAIPKKAQWLGGIGGLLVFNSKARKKV